MGELKDLTQLIKIAECGTISRAAEELYISQPALSRSMQRLEERVGVQLFSRGKNKVQLNQNGLMLVELAKGILADCDSAFERVRAFDRERNTLSIGSCAPAPMWRLAEQLSLDPRGLRITTQICADEQLMRGLADGSFKVAIFNHPVQREGVECFEYFTENLLLCLPAEHRLAKKSSVSFADIDGITMLLYEGIGVWRGVTQRLAHTRFIVQSGYNDFSDLVSQSTLPSFATDAAIGFKVPRGRVVVPVSDREASQTFYIAVKKTNKKYLPHNVIAKEE